METLNLTIFGNFYINSEETFLRLKDSFKSFYSFDPKEWVIGVRGCYKYHVREYLSLKISEDKLSLVILDDKSNWIKESQKLFKIISCRNIFIWVEDHICQVNKEKFISIVKEFESNQIDQMVYTFWHKSLQSRIDFLSPNIYNYFKAVNLPTNKKRYLINNGIEFMNGLPAIYSRKFLNRILFSKKPFLKRWPKYTPFDFEKKITDKLPPHNYAVPLLEIFAPIDDDHGEFNSGYRSLQSRGQYPKRVSREEHLITTSRKKNRNKLFNIFFKNKLVSNIYFLFKRIIFTFS